ncbi:AsmA family protein [Marinicella litoralis]|uniref:Uncharacterized protein involved in outer membrane biogenesis n=1 Tax=Marinicella litoralis TaxID=644220 RepID=A0A4R6XKF4_9GAMM|nr:AsmA family protein [Marinicella litoralis]TDR18460.1 uncharacterized protein involved in outer membrane biogenesis [Marinicella litoralis]
MKKLIKWLVGLVAFLALLLVLAVILLPLVFDPNEHKVEIQRAASEQVGRDVSLNGPIEWSVFPWIAINLSDVDIANEKGFKGDFLAQVEQVSVRVKLLPLFSKQIKIGQVELVHPEINLQVAQSGRSNWQSIVNTLSGTTDEVSPDSGSSSDLEIKGISITQGTLNYTDAPADLQLEMTDLSFQSEAIKAGIPTDMNLTANLNLPIQNLTGQLSATWKVQNLTSGLGPVFDFSTLDLDGEMDAVLLKLTTGGEMVVDLAADSMKINLLTAQYGPMKVSTPVRGTQLSSNMSLSGAAVIDAFTLTELFEAMGSPVENQANNELSGSGSWSLVGDRLQLNQLKMTLDESSISGDVDVKQLSQMKGQFNLNINQMNMDDYLPNETTSSVAVTNKQETATMDLGQLSGQIKMGHLQLMGLQLSDITLNIKTQGKNITVEPLQAGFYQGLIKTELKLQPDNDSGKLQVMHQMKDFQAGDMLTDLMGTDYLTGLGQLIADIKIDEPFSERPFKTANGTLSYQLSDGDIVGIDVFQIMQKSLSLLNKSDVINNNEELKTAFGLMDIQATVSNGVLKTQTLKITSPYFNLDGDVEIDLDQQTIRGTIKPMLTNIPEGVLDKNFEKLLNIRIPVSLRGNLLEPDVSIDIEKLILESQKAKIDEKKEELKEDLFDALLGTKKNKKESNDPITTDGEPPVELTEKQKRRAEKDQAKRDLLESLLGGSKDKKDPEEKDADTDDGNQ